MVNLATYRDMLAQPWGKIQYDITFAQLAHLEDLTILDFGAGFGLVSQFLAQKNTVTAVEPNADMLFADDSQTFTKQLGSLDVLKRLSDQSFDVICCHNVLEYIPFEKYLDYWSEFYRLLKPNGQVSLIKHNPVGKIFQSVVFADDVTTALDLLDGKEFQSLSFAQGKTYTIEDAVSLSQLDLEHYQGIRTFYSLQPNDVKTKEGWLDKMLNIELAVCDLSPYKDVSFLQHLWLRKSDRMASPERQPKDN
ncbi:class I SAM-dependent methyltransferase [Streptococcus suis]|nr:class I SAM-dependent methyltransferase [Streptococcus suis]